MSSIDTQQLAPRAALVHRIAEELGFALVGVAPAEASDYGDELREWLHAGKHGEMDYLARHAEQRIDPREMVPGARAVICVADVYPVELDSIGHEQGDLRQEGTGGQAASGTRAARFESPHQMHDSSSSSHSPAGRIARYAWGDDYHKVMKRRLFELADALRAKWPDHEYRACVDTAPVLEREHATRAGLGWTGKHTLLIHPRLGSWLLLGEVITTLPIEASEQAGWPGRTVPPTDHCGTCTRCIDACPTGCITPYSLDASRCISYLTIEHRGLIDDELHAAMGGWLAGCDVCQEVCPHNDPTSTNNTDERSPPVHPRYAPRPPAPALPLAEVLDWSADDRRRALTGSALKRIKLDMWKRNALIAAGNHLLRQGDRDENGRDEDHHDEDASLRKRIEALADNVNESDLVRDTARQVQRRLTKRAGRDHRDD